MHITAFNTFVCPLDGLPLTGDKKSLSCEKKHLFDLAKEGYYNLLLVQNKRSLNPGDSKEMVQARRRFLDGGYYYPIAERVFAFICEMAMNAPSGVTLRVVDAGCGEGYYLHTLSQKASVNNYPVRLELAGVDISKWAVKKAAQRPGPIAWAVASNRQIPFAAGNVDIILSVFGFPVWESFKSAQPQGGHALLVDPGPDHLLELRKIIYPQVKTAGISSVQAAIDCGYGLVKKESLKFLIQLKSASAIQDLLAMTPHAFRMPIGKQKEINALKELNVHVDVTFRLLRKNC